MKDENLLAGLIAGESVSKYTEDELMFNKAAQSYLDKFGGSLPFGIGMPEISTELLLKAVAGNKKIKELPIPDDAVS